ncbi:choline ABC transporter ATP-binding protein [Limoniibacter endophyticus]|uniref:Trimethylamine N-oxide transport system ATP-binding protein TmoW n=1 Tax=Limoniibacter endophyticus TaxID=1565040 RepID=A0A8J3DN16_9HYPH|nr:choline ABC transporter ATP-binding protein [Limoniibacter endophyticus]GHC65360.1 choline ABC transporter ATP-binding protein [Limoniibacter endophyticus]
MTAAIEFRDIDVVFSDDPARALSLLDQGKTRDEIAAQARAVVGCANVSLSIQPGEISVLMGLSGSGKSTLLRTVNRLNAPTRGKVLVNGSDGLVDTARCDEKRLRAIRRNDVAMVFQQFALLPWRTVADNVALGLEFSGLPQRQRRERVEEQLDLVGLTQWREKYAHELSGGMQQRVGLARALATHAPILLMDEPFSALDPLIRAKLQDDLLDLQNRLKKTILFVSHDLDEALKLGNRISIMQDGRLIQNGAPEEIVLSPANDYVREFIASVNPLSFLTAWNIMTDWRDLDAENDRLWLDTAHRAFVSLDIDRRIEAAKLDGDAATIIPCDVDPQEWPAAPGIFVATPETSLRKVVLAMHHAGAAPIAIMDRDNRLMGAVSIEAVLKAIVRRETRGG